MSASLLILLPGLATTGTSLPAYERTIYTAFGNVSSADFDLLAWGSSHLPSGSRVLVAPGSAAEFLSGYAPGAIVLFPMADGVEINASYAVLDRELTNATLDAAGDQALASLGVNYIAVTGSNNQLFRPFLPTPFEGRAGFPLVFHEADAYLFERA